MELQQTIEQLNHFAGNGSQLRHTFTRFTRCSSVGSTVDEGWQAAAHLLAIRPGSLCPLAITKASRNRQYVHRNPETPNRSCAAPSANPALKLGSTCPLQHDGLTGRHFAPVTLVGCPCGSNVHAECGAECGAKSQEEEEDLDHDSEGVAVGHERNPSGTVCLVQLPNS